MKSRHGSASSLSPGIGSRDGAKSGMRDATRSGMGTGVKATGSGTKVFGRLETHVKSTIPQSEIEKRGDDYYRQGQLPLAMNCWKEGFDEAPHAGLKIKVELAERELKREAFGIAMDEARHRYTTGDYKASIERAREAILSADNDAQRQEAMRLESAAIDESRTSNKSRSIKTVLLGVGALAVLAIAIFAFKSASHDDPADGDGSSNPPPDERPIKKPAPGGAATGPKKHLFQEAKASVETPRRWFPLNNAMLQVLVPGTQADYAVAMQVQPLPDNLTAEARFAALSARSSLKNAKPRDTPNPHFRTVDNAYEMAEISYNYDGKDEASIQYIFLVPAPPESGAVKGYSIVFDGRESTFTDDLQQEMHDIMQSWTFTTE
jgi:tetratricopeptide (TPR) repeat protein